MSYYENVMEKVKKINDLAGKNLIKKIAYSQKKDQIRLEVTGLRWTYPCEMAMYYLKGYYDLLKQALEVGL